MEQIFELLFSSISFVGYVFWGVDSLFRDCDLFWSGRKKDNLFLPKLEEDKDKFSIKPNHPKIAKCLRNVVLGLMIASMLTFVIVIFLVLSSVLSFTTALCTNLCTISCIVFVLTALYFSVGFYISPLFFTGLKNLIISNLYMLKYFHSS